MPSVSVQFFAILRQQAGTSTASLETASTTPRALYEELAVRHRFTLAPKQVRAAVNDAFVDWETPLRDGDRVAFIPPVAGG